MQNPYIERFNRTYRNDVLDLCLFRSWSEVRKGKDRALRYDSFAGEVRCTLFRQATQAELTLVTTRATLQGRYNHFIAFKINPLANI